MDKLFHFTAAMFWRFVLIVVTPLALFDYYEPAVWSGFYVIYHDEQWM